jgi:protein TonB
MAVALLGCLSFAAGWSCTKEPPARDPANSGIANEAAVEAPELPIDVMPKVVKASVSYPEEARIRGEEGIVYVKALVGKDGKVTEAVVDPAQPASAVLGKAAVEAVGQWSFEPAKAKGEPVAIWIVVPVNFKLH